MSRLTIDDPYLTPQERAYVTRSHCSPAQDDSITSFSPRSEERMRIASTTYLTEDLRNGADYAPDTAPVDRRALFGNDNRIPGPVAAAYPEGFDPDHRTNPNIPPPVEPDADVISDAEGDRLIDRMASFDERRRRYRAQAEARCRDVDNEEKHFLFVHGTDLQEWTRSKLRGKSRSVKRATGTAGFRTVPAHATIFDHPTALAYCQQHLPEAVKPIVDPKKVLTGETEADGTPMLPPGVEWVPARETFTVKGVRDIEGDDSDDDA